MTRLFRALPLLPCLVAALHAQITPARPMPPVVTIEVDAQGNQGTVPREVFGTFLEPIDNSINNGVAAEILVNGSLEGGLWNHASLEAMFRDQPELIESMNSTGIPIPWEPLNPAAGNRFELHAGDAANSWQSLEIMGLPGGLTGIMQRVYLPVQRTLDYRVSIYAKHLSGPSTIVFSIRSHATAAVLAQASVQATGSEWTRYETTLRLPQGAVRRLEPVNFAVSVEGNGRTDVDQISLTPADAEDGIDPDVLKMSAKMNMTELRFGGNFSSYYHWRDGVGPRDKRITTENIAWGIPEANNFGTDEFLAFCKHLGVIPQFDLNMGSGSPQEAADWVRYIREHYQGPLILEMGNELYGKWQVGYPTIDEIAQRTLDFSKAVRPLAPNATLIATGQTPNGNPAWNTSQFTNPPASFDLLSTHFIVGTNHVVMKPYSPDFMAAAAYAVPFAVGERFDRMQAQADEAGHRNTHFAVTEWLFNSKGAGERNFTNESPSSRNEGGAVMIAGAFNTYFRHNSEIKLVDLTGLMEFAGIWKRREQVFATPAYYVFGLYSAVKNQTVLPVSSNTGTYNVHQGTEGFADVQDVPYIDTVATLSEDKRTLTLFCVNRSLTQDVDTQIHLKNFQPAGSGETQQINAVSRYVMNDEVEPQQVIPIPGSTHANSDGSLRITLPHESVTRIQLQSR